jgi:hypothetical protein
MIDLKATKRSLINETKCPKFPDSEWKNVISRKAINLDAVLSGQLSITQDGPKVEKFGDLEISFGALNPIKLTKTGEIGLLPGTEQSELLHSLSPIESMNSPAMASISSTYLQSHTPASIAVSSPSTTKFRRELAVSGISNSPIMRNFPILRSRT